MVELQIYELQTCQQLQNILSKRRARFFEGFLLWRYMKNTCTALALDCNKLYRFKILN